MKVIIITGGIGSGKSEVCGILHEMGIEAQYNADKRVKALYDEHPSLLDDIQKAVGTDLRGADGKFMPQKLSNMIFGDRKVMKTVENLVFPALMEDFRAFVRRHPDDEYIIFESATALEKPYFDGFGDKTVLVDAPYSIRLDRACMRDGASRDAVEARMACQPLMNALSDGHADPRIDAVITNDAGLDELKMKTREVISHLFDN